MICQFCGKKMEFIKAVRCGLTWTRPEIRCDGCGFAIKVQADVVQQGSETIFEADERCKNDAENYLKEKYERGEPVRQIQDAFPSEVRETSERIYPTGR